MESHLNENSEIKASELRRRKARVPGSEYAASTSQVPPAMRSDPGRPQVKEPTVPRAVRSEPGRPGRPQVKKAKAPEPKSPMPPPRPQRSTRSQMGRPKAEKKPSNRHHDTEKKTMKPCPPEKPCPPKQEYGDLSLNVIQYGDLSLNVIQHGGIPHDLQYGDLSLNVIQGASGDQRPSVDGWDLKDVLEWVFPITNFTLELPSAVFDQLSSKNHPHYAFIVMLFSFIALMSCIAELIYKGKMERVTLQWRGSVPWFYLPTGKPFGTLLDKIGFACAFLQCVVTTINYSFISRHRDGPINVCVLPILLAFGLLCSKYFKNPVGNRGGNPRFNRGALQV